MRDAAAEDRYRSTLYWYGLLFFAFLVGANVFVYHHQKESLEAESDRSGETVVKLLSQLAREALLTEDYATIEWFFQRWGEEHPNVVELELRNERGFRLVDYRNPGRAPAFVHQRQLDLGNGERYTLRLVRDAEAIQAPLGALLRQLILASSVTTLLLAALAWTLLRWKMLLPLEREVSLRKAAEEKVGQQSRFLQTIIDSVEEQIMVIGHDYEVTLMNRAVRRNADFAHVADPAHPKCHEISHQRTTPCDGEDHPCPIHQVLETGRPCSVIHNHSLKDGTPNYVELHTSLLQCQGRDFFGIIEVGVNVTEHLKSREMLLRERSQLHHDAHHDPLTMLPNRRLFSEKLQHAIGECRQKGCQMGLLFIDLDRFKEINDNLGHGIGDLVLRHIADKLSRNVRAGDVVTRLGGDEFTVILSDLGAPEHAEIVAGKLLDTLHRPFTIDDRIIKISCSIGISIYPDDGDDAEALIQHADEAMYQVKEQGRDGIVRFNRSA